MPKDLLLGVDVGSTRMKAALFDIEGRQVALTYDEYPILHNEPLAAEHGVAYWLSSFKSVVRGVIRKSRVSAKHILAVSVDCLCPSLIPVNRNGKPLMNSIFFMDRRSMEEANWMEKTIGSKTFFSITANRISHSAFSAPIMLWIKRTRPRVYAKTFKFLHANGFLEKYLTDEFTMDWSNASFTLLFETRGRKRWSSKLSQELGLPVDKLPDLKAPWDVVGEVTQTAARETGLAKGTTVIAGGADTACAALGVGALNDGDAMEDGGTATKLAVCMSKPNFPTGTLNRCHVTPDRWLAVAASSTTGALLRWLKDLLGGYGADLKGVGRNAYSLMDADARKSPPGANGLIVLPYFAPGGERSPIWDPYAHGVIFGLNLSHQRRDLVRAVLEASAYALRHNIEMIERQGIKVRKIRLSGGQARSESWRRIKADVTGKPVELTSHVEATVFGTALLAGFGSGVFSNLEHTVKAVVRIRETKLPDPSTAQVYGNAFSAYKNVYDRLRPEFERVYS
jgi:xylulokinase